MPAASSVRTVRDDGSALEITVDAGPRSPVMLVAHGAGSTPDFARRCFGPAAARRGWRLATYWMRGHGGQVTPRRQLGGQSHVDDLATVARALGDDLYAVGGISLGAHTAALWAARQAPASLGLLALALPAWTGAPDAVAAANAAQAEVFRQVGVAEALRQLTEAHPGWIADELAASWPQHDPETFVAVLDELAVSTAPTEPELASIRVSTSLVALADDPLHPAAVARRWATAIPGARYSEVTVAQMGARRDALGEAALSGSR